MYVCKAKGGHSNKQCTLSCQQFRYSRSTDGDTLWADTIVVPAHHSTCMCTCDGVVLQLKASLPRLHSSPAMSKKGPLSCKWSTCHQQDIIFATPDDLAEHVHSNHIALFCDEEVVVCLWEGCKVYNKPSSSYTWLQRHMQQVHTKERPFKCIMNGCNLSFQSTDALQRHLERHLDPAPMPVSKTLATNVYPKPSPFVTVTQDNLLLPAKRQCLETESSASDSAAESKKWSHHLHSKGPGDTLKPRRRQSSLKVRIPRHSLLFAFSTPSVCGPAPLNGQL